MKIAFVGKGGSGKTTVASLVARTLASRKLPVIAIDGDINQHLGESLGLTPKEASAIPPLGIEIARVKEYLRGDNPLIQSVDLMQKTTPPGPGSRLLRVSEHNPIYEHFALNADGVKFMAVGPFAEEDLGMRCYHSKTGAIELLLNHTIDGEKEYVLVDMTAGADSFSSGLFTRFDVTFLVVEPTRKSLSVYDQYKKYAESHHVVIRVIANKVEGADDIEFIRGRVGEDLVATLPMSPYVKALERGDLRPLSVLEERTREALSKIVARIDVQKKDWKRYFVQAGEFHRKNAESWGNAAAGHDLVSQIPSDLDFFLSSLHT